jgi:hypothetical protein
MIERSTNGLSLDMHHKDFSSVRLVWVATQRWSRGREPQLVFSWLTQKMKADHVEVAMQMDPS